MSVRVEREPDRGARALGSGVRLGPELASLGLYLVASLVCFGLPLLGGPSHTVIAVDSTDSSLFQWFFAWWPHALLHGIDPFVTHAMFVPEGFNLQWTTSMPGPSLLLAPVTLTAGPAVTYNLIQLAAPALSAWAAFLLCHHLTRRFGPSLAGGWLFGFSPYVLAHLTGSPFLALVPVLPILVMLVVRRVDGSLGARRFVVLMVVALVVQFSISTEVLAATALFGGAGLLLAAALLPAQRRAVLEAAGLTLAAGVVMAVIVSPFLYVFFFGRHYPPQGTFFSSDPGSLLGPPGYMALSGASRRPPGLFQPSGEGYLGLPLIVIVVAFAWTRRRRPVTWLPVGCLGLAAILSLGRVLYTGSRYTTIPLPWRLLDGLPVLRYAIPIRFAVFAILPAAVIAALWLAQRPSRGRWALTLLAVAAFVPDIGNAAWHTAIRDPPFFAQGTYRHYLTAADRVLTIPTRGASERWQADTGFPFALAAGYAGAYPRSYSRFAAFTALTGGTLPPHPAADLQAFIRAKGVTAIVVDPRTPGPWRQLLATLRVRPIAAGGVLVYRLSRSS